jgi:hypothetical protein
MASLVNLDALIPREDDPLETSNSDPVQRRYDGQDEQ